MKPEIALPIKRFVGKYIIKPPTLEKLPLNKRREKLIKFYKEKTGKDLDLDNCRSFTDKLQWVKLYYKHPDMLKIVDKYLFKDYIKEKLGDGYVANLITVYNSPNEVKLCNIKQDKFVIKSTLQSDGNFIILVKDKNKVDLKSIEKEIKKNWFNKRKLLNNSFCSAYYGAKPRVIVEEYIEEFEGEANDYKLFCFGGNPKFFYVAEDHFKNGENSDNYPITFYSLDWKPMDVSYGKHQRNEKVSKPYHIDQMIEISKKLSEGFPFIRVDFFDTPNKLYLAELTFYPGGGVTSYCPQSFDDMMGDMLKL